VAPRLASRRKPRRNETGALALSQLRAQAALFLRLADRARSAAPPTASELAKGDDRVVVWAAPRPSRRINMAVMVIESSLRLPVRYGGWAEWRADLAETLPPPPLIAADVASCAQC